MNRSDSFIRPDSATSIDPPSDGGTNWNVLSGTWGVINDTGYCPVAPPSADAVLQSLSSDVVLQVTIDVVGTGYGLTARASNASNYLLAAWSGGNYLLFRQVAGSFTNIGTVAGTPQAGDVWQFVLSGTSVTLQVNGTPVLTATESANLTNTQHGLHSAGDTAVRFGRFYATAIIPPPLNNARGLLPATTTYWVYNPATTLALSSLTVWMQPRNVVLKGVAADAAVAWLQENTPIQMQF